jgi:hypothetical protein
MATCHLHCPTTHFCLLACVSALPAAPPSVCHVPPNQILTPRKLFVLASKVSVFPSNAISLQEVSPRYDDAKGTIHLDVSDERGDTGHRACDRAHRLLHAFG